MKNKFFLLFFGLMVSCAVENKDNTPIFESMAIDDATSIIASADSSALFIGTDKNHFYEHNIKNNTTVKFELPPCYDGVLTYFVRELPQNDGKRTFLVSKRNNGVLLVRYTLSHNNEFVYNRDKSVELYSESAPDIVPDKGLKYSAYEVVEVKDSINGNIDYLFATSCGLMHISWSELKKSLQEKTSDQQMELKYVKALRNHRNYRQQFSVAEVIMPEDASDRLIAVTDSCIYRLNAEMQDSTVDATLACGCFVSAYIKDNILYALRANGSLSTELVTITNAFGEYQVDSTKWENGCKILGPVVSANGNGNLILGKEHFDVGITVRGKHSMMSVGNNLYYISGNSLRRTNIARLKKMKNVAHSIVKCVVAGDDCLYVINDKGLYAVLANNDMIFLGKVVDMPYVKDVCWHDDYIYICDDRRVYKISTSNDIFAHVRTPQKLDFVKLEEADKIESILVDEKDNLYVGTRNLLKYYNPKDKNEHIIKFDNLLYESLYVTDMAMCKDEILISTLNHGAYLVDVEKDRVKIERWKFREGGEIREIERIDVNDKHLVVKTPSGLFVDQLFKNDNETKKISGDILDFKAINDEVYIVFADSVKKLFKGEKTPNILGYSMIENVNGRPMLISPYSIVSDKVLNDDSLTWGFVICVTIVLLLIAIGVLVLIKHFKRRLNESEDRYNRKESEISDIVTMHEKYAMSRSVLSDYLQKLLPQKSVEDYDLDKLVGIYKRFYDVILSIEDSDDKDKKVKLWSNAYKNLCNNVESWFKDIKNDPRRYELLQKMFLMFNVYPKQGLKRLTVHEDVNYHWQLFVRYVIDKEDAEKAVEKVINLMIKTKKLKNEDVLSTKKQLRECINHANIGTIPKFVYYNLTPHFWDDKSIIPQTPFDVVWRALDLWKNINLVEEMDKTHKSLKSKQ
ncbi:MAG: hypothetical protein IKZ14_02170 [Muribaculaceae bacterium]|nr:hypothetical protein [Muribaculaceae bacterium]